MTIRRIVPNVATAQPELCREFYADFLGLRVAMDMGWIATYVSPSNPTAQISIVRGESAEAPQAAITITVEVDDVDRAHRDATARISDCLSADRRAVGRAPIRRRRPERCARERDVPPRAAQGSTGHLTHVACRFGQRWS